MSLENLGLFTQCPHCKAIHVTKTLKNNLEVCPNSSCQRPLRLTARERIEQLVDADSYLPLSLPEISDNPLDFPGYDEALEKHRSKTGEPEAIQIGTGHIKGHPVVLAVTDFNFMGGSMGRVVGEALTIAIEHALIQRLPVVLISGSGGGARIYEGICALMQMAKTSMALAQHHEAGLFSFVVQTDATMGGVLASWASLGTLVLAEPKAMIGFTGGRVSKTVLKSGKLPDNWQTSEFQAEHGNIDLVVTRADLPKVISFCLDWTACTSYETSWRTAHEAKSP